MLSSCGRVISTNKLAPFEFMSGFALHPTFCRHTKTNRSLILDMFSQTAYVMQILSSYYCFRSYKSGPSWNSIGPETLDTDDHQYILDLGYSRYDMTIFIHFSYCQGQIFFSFLECIHACIKCYFIYKIPRKQMDK